MNFSNHVRVITVRRCHRVKKDRLNSKLHSTAARVTCSHLFRKPATHDNLKFTMLVVKMPTATTLLSLQRTAAPDQLHGSTSMSSVLWLAKRDHIANRSACMLAFSQRPVRDQTLLWLANSSHQTASTNHAVRGRLVEQGHNGRRFLWNSRAMSYL